MFLSTAYLKIPLVFLFVAITTTLSPGAEGSSCNNNTRIECYDCDTRYSTRCNGPFSNTTVNTKSCSGCCAVMQYKPPQNYIIRTCINLQYPLTRQSSDNLMTTYCNENLCNAGSLEMKIMVPLLLAFVLATVVRDNKTLL